MPSPTLLEQPQEHLSLEALSEEPQALGELLPTIRRHLHRHPEVGMHEYATSRFIRETLEGYGLDVRGPVAETGLIVDIEGASSHEKGPRVAYRADIDALPMQDAKSVPYRSTREGVAHLCGHDAHTAVALGAALLLQARRHTLAGSARVFFQPNEESIPSGAPMMIEEGALEGVRTIYAIHVEPTLKTGRYGLRVGPITAANDRFDVIVRAEQSGHSARPHETVDTVWVATQIAQALYQLAGRVTDARHASVITLCRFEGGQAHNVIPAEVTFGGTLRAIREKDREVLRRKMRRVARQTAHLYGATAELDVTGGAPPVVNDAGAVKTARRAVIEQFGEDAVYDIPQPSMGGEDFAYYVRETPGALIRVGTQDGVDSHFPLHDNRFDLDESALAPTARLVARLLEKRLQEGG